MTAAGRDGRPAAAPRLLLRLAPALAVAGVLLLAHPGGVRAAAEDPCVDDLENEYANDAEAIAYGKRRFGQRCAFCHGGGGRGAKGPSLIAGKFKRGACNADIVENIASGVPGTQMGAFGDKLDFDEIMKILAYMRDEEARLRAAGEID